jgi:2-polyprenyl-6-methoxyphenol hydroxylase-like FAD-dependent oxidoreductase
MHSSTRPVSPAAEPGGFTSSAAPGRCVFTGCDVPLPAAREQTLSVDIGARQGCDVVVVGAGPTGLMLASELALAGVAVAVIERQVAPSGQSRGGGINSRTSEVLAMRGILDAVIERGIPTESGPGHFAGLPVPLDTRPWRTRYPYGVCVPQDRLEEVFENRLRELGVAVRRCTELTG